MPPQSRAGLAALSTRHIEQSQSASNMIKELSRLSKKRQTRENELAHILREGRAAIAYVADMQARMPTKRVWCDTSKSMSALYKTVDLDWVI